MDYKEIKAELGQNKIRPVYLLYGEERFFCRQLAKAIIAKILPPTDTDTNLTEYDREPPLAELVAAVETLPFFGDKNVVLVRNFTVLAPAAGAKAADGNEAQGEQAKAGAEGKKTKKTDKNTGEELLLQLLADMPAYSCLILLAEKADKRRKLYKAIEKYGAVVENVALKGRELRSWLSNRLAELNIKMRAEAAEYLLAAVSMMPKVSLDFLENELAKVQLYNKGTGMVTLSALQQTLAAAPEISAFAMLEALSQKKLAAALQLLAEQIAAGEHPVKILSLLARQCRQLWQTGELAAQGGSSRAIADYFHLPPFIGEKLLQQSKSFSQPKLKKALLALAAADIALKTSQAGPAVIEEIMIELCAD